MTKEELIKLVKNPKFVSGIYNYCDRWCERCVYTDRCLLFAQSEEDLQELGDTDITGKELTDKIQDIFAMTREMIDDLAKKEGIDISKAQEDKTFLKHKQRRKQIVEKSPLVKMGKKYIDEVMNWFKNGKQSFEVIGKEWESGAMMGLKTERDLKKDAAILTDIIEIIRWYQFQICVKFTRALSSQANEHEEEDFWKDYPKDSDGSAKVALLGIDNSLKAWRRMSKFFPDDDRILYILALLEKMKKTAEKQFPDARNFVRPGIDTGGK